MAASIEIKKEPIAQPVGNRYQKIKIVRPRSGGRAFPGAVPAKC